MKIVSMASRSLPAAASGNSSHSGAHRDDNYKRKWQRDGSRVPLTTQVLLLLTASWLTMIAPVNATCRQGCSSSNTYLGDEALVDNTGGVQNTAIGDLALTNSAYADFCTAVGGYALASNITGDEDTAVGYGALFASNWGPSTAVGAYALFGHIGGGAETAVGDRSLYTGGGWDDTAVGSFALYFANDQAVNNTAIGAQALYNDSSGHDNTATGDFCLFNNTTGNFNTAVGAEALHYSQTASDNTAVGYGALFNDTTGGYNTASGYHALYTNTTSSYNTANGNEALYNSTATFNTATGHRALYNDTTGAQNTAIGANALYFNASGSYNIASGDEALYNSTGSSNIGLGYRGGYSLTTGSNNIDIGNIGVAAESATIRLGTKTTHTNTYIAGISGATVPGGIGVIVDSNGHLGTSTSSARYKKNIQPMHRASEAILSLQPVTFRYREELDPQGIPQFGLVAEQVEEISPELVAHDDQGKPYSVRYEAVNAMLLNEFLKEHRKVEEQEVSIADLKATAVKQAALLAQQQAAIARLTSQVQEVNAALESRAHALLVTNNQ